MDSTNSLRDRGQTFKSELLAKNPKFGIFLNSASSTVAEQVSHSGYDWLLVDTQHGPMDSLLLGSMLNAISSGNCLSMVRVSGHNDRAGIQQALDLGANGILIPYVNTAQEAREGISCCLYPTQGTRSVYFPQRCTNKDGLLGYVGNSNKNVVIAVQIETASSIKNIDEIVGLPGLDIAFLGPNDLCMSMGLFEKYEFPLMYTSVELNAAVKDMLTAVEKHKKTAGVFVFGTDRVGEFLNLGFNFISIGNDLHHVLTQTGAHVNALETITKGHKNGEWKHLPTKLF
jgi:4-hydroxy-2-oxoheptanedioate aldolase